MYGQVMTIIILTSLTKILNSQQMINLSQSFPSFKLSTSSSGYRCGCGDAFSRCIEFKEHSLLLHDGQYIDNSSHFLSPITNIVLPVHQPTNNQINTKISAKSREFQENQPCEIETASKIQPVRATNTAKKQKEEGKSFSTIKTKKGKSVVVVEPIAENASENEQVIEWNGFQLIKNKKCQIKPFYCGKCKITFTLAEELIIHCIEVCKRLKHRDSSHLISCTFDQQQQSENEEEDQKNHKQQKDIQKRQNKREKRNVFRQIIIKKSDHRHLPSYCGYCHKSFENISKYYYDIKNNHSEIVHPSSSHIMLRFIYPKPKSFNCFITESVEWPYQQQDYFCSCKPDVKMNMAKLIKHVRQVHKGISPIYPQQYSRQYKIKTNQSQSALRKESQDATGRQLCNNHADCQEQKQVEKYTAPYMKIFNDHKHRKITYSNPPYICYLCNKQIYKGKYTNHLKFHDSNQEKNDSSHIIIVISSNKKYLDKHLLISVNQQWKIKDAIYACPCDVDKKMTMKELIRHVADQHNFISPKIYHIIDHLINDK